MREKVRIFVAETFLLLSLCRILLKIFEPCGISLFFGWYYMLFLPYIFSSVLLLTRSLLRNCRKSIGEKENGKQGKELGNLGSMQQMAVGHHGVIAMEAQKVDIIMYWVIPLSFK
ncbi:MAG: hypothetical protein UDG28_01530 [Prevotellamassilia sp.]|nr:hypothetical protein [Prevotellamassilia sp.]